MFRMKSKSESQDNLTEEYTEYSLVQLVSVKFLSEEDIIEVMVRFQASADLPQFGARSLLTRRTVELELETRLMGTRT